MGRPPNAERIWNALERAGKTSVAVHYPAAHPSGIQSGFVVDGFVTPDTLARTMKLRLVRRIRRAMRSLLSKWTMMERLSVGHSVAFNRFQPYVRSRLGKSSAEPIAAP